jgi:Lipid-binding putative hydrolase
MKQIALYFILLITLNTLFSSCSKDLPDPGGTGAEKLSGEWFVKVTFDGNTTDYIKIMTYNTAANNDSLWIDDLESFWQFKVKAKFDGGGLTFATANAQNGYYDSKVTISNGKVIQNVSTTESGAVVDSIYFEAKFDDDPDNLTYIFSGHMRSGFLEDEH